MRASSSAVRTLVAAFAFAGGAAAFAACSSFGDATVTGNDAGSPDTASSGDGVAPADSGAPDASDTGTDIVLVNDHFDVEAACGAWEKKHFVPFDFVPTGGHGDGGACRICVVDPTNAQYVQKNIVPPRKGHYRVTSWFRQSAGKLPPLQDHAVGYQFLVDGNAAAPRVLIAQGAVDAEWASATNEGDSPDGTTVVNATIEVDGPAGTCYEVDDVLLTVTPAP